MSAAIVAAMRERYKVPEWALFFEVGSGTGASYRRSADALVMGCFPSRGLLLHGFEFKTSRSDWLRELKQPEKAEPVFQYCDRWWLVVDHKDVVHEGELPAPWGLLVLRGSSLVQAKEAPLLEAKPWSRTFLAAVLRNACKGSATQQELREAEERGRKQEGARWKAEAELRGREYQDLLSKVREFEVAAGIDIKYGWKHGLVGKAVHALVNGSDDLRHSLQYARNRLGAQVTSLDQAIAALETQPELAALRDLQQQLTEEEPR